MTRDPKDVADQVGPAREETLTELRQIAKQRRKAQAQIYGTPTEHYYTLIRLAHKLGIPNKDIEEATSLSKVQISKIIARRGVSK